MRSQFEQFDLVVVPFLFTDRTATKRRPALILSDIAEFNTLIDCSVMTMIATTAHAPWPLDVPIQDLASTGLQANSIIRMKLFTLDHALVLRKIGKLANTDVVAVKDSLQQLFKLSRL
ncbi:type II toxin-antitoxin system PemK/MazF family toxin [Candidatus Synechococcus calcipolaris G9]|uniref:Type II toxin-antitoxin system PemK/MazF family toxin n=1 Tax=Candidatus Synechococcus calcipolaris G9 TaxID=1497997 RepID=A0ABT6EYD4_9SYNE|nr:type II toxin-antitoxin system PemK/MazF family toxin [Candidatus Synechococcus calcipolaris]MDG2990809.1 type II toxin-antitoxin system PemK/MazF family toxin [Candidatus Synechococcus calcipolaris G9]